MTIQQLQQYPLGEKGLRIQEQFRYKILYVNGISAPDTIEASIIENGVELSRLMDVDAATDSEDFFLPLLYPLSALTQEIEVYGEKFVPMVELFKIARGCYQSGELWPERLDSSTMRFMLGYREYVFSLVKDVGDVRLGDGYSFRMYYTDLEGRNRKEDEVQFTNLLFRKMDSWFINYQGIEAVSPFELKENPYK